MPTWIPQPKQETFLKNPAFEAGFGGAKGPGKTDALIVDGSAQIEKPNYKAILFRRTHKQLEEIYLRTLKWFTPMKASWNGDKKCWTFPTRAKFYLSHCQHEKDKENHQGQEYHWMGFDQLESFSKTIYDYLKMQVRTTDPTINCFIRASFNPGGIGHAWVKKHFIDVCPFDGKVRSFIKVGDEYKQVNYGTPGSLTRAFVFSTIYDNKHILENDPTYLANLESLPEKMRKAMKDGDWDAFEGQYFSEFDRGVHVLSYSQFMTMARELPTTRFAY